MTEKIDEIMIETVGKIIETYGNKDHVICTGELKKLVSERYGANKGSVIPSDYCYNIINKGIDPQKKPRLLLQAKRGEYRCCGLNFPYNGPVMHKGRIVGQCVNGIITTTEECGR